MKDRCRSFLVAAPAVLKLFLILLLLSSPDVVGVQARKLLLSRSAVSHSKQEHQQVDSLEFSRSSGIPTNQAAVSLRRIPPSNSNPTQNKSRPRFDGSGSRNP